MLYKFSADKAIEIAFYIRFTFLTEISSTSLQLVLQKSSQKGRFILFVFVVVFFLAHCVDCLLISVSEYIISA